MFLVMFFIVNCYFCLTWVLTTTYINKKAWSNCQNLAKKLKQFTITRCLRFLLWFWHPLPLFWSCDLVTWEGWGSISIKEMSHTNSLSCTLMLFGWNLYMMFILVKCVHNIYSCGMEQNKPFFFGERGGGVERGVYLLVIKETDGLFPTSE